MSHKMRIDTLKSAAEAAGVAMAPSSDEFGDDAHTGFSQRHLLAAPAVDPAAGNDAGNYSRTWARPVFREGFDTVKAHPHPTLWHWLAWRRPGALST